MNYLLLLLFAINSFAICVREKHATKFEIEALKKIGHNIFISDDGIKFKKLHLSKLEEDRTYFIQYSNKKHVHKIKNRFLEYYTPKRLDLYLDSISHSLDKIGYKKILIGKSIKGRNLYKIVPKKIENKKTILMFGRHHGDEGTANWLIEGFLNKYIQDVIFHKNFQLILYPMINPDGAQAKTRYNANGLDLNRSWNVTNYNKNLDEIKIIHTDLYGYLTKLKKQIPIVLDMHGSIREDFIYRVDRSFKGRAFFNHQQKFIDELAKYDTWQRGKYIESNGHPGMARIVMINHYEQNALTHETIKNIKKSNSKARTVESLKQQGRAVLDTIKSLY
ncbi:MAG: M14 family zinc carboxypeptidase [Bacteriovoracaceae bacterium]|jgi:hypothetical protein|nr:M14 family zinc carboxypeptidase [Bacteriovoracaceae bacterium]